MPRRIGYARAAVGEMSLAAQIEALQEAGCEEVITDDGYQLNLNRPGLRTCLEKVALGDTLLVLRLCRIGCSISELISLMLTLKERGVHFRSLQDGAINTAAVSGQQIFNIFACLASFERTMAEEKTNIGLKVARARGRLGGRKPLPSNHPKITLARQMSRDHSKSISEICSTLKISRATYYRYLSLDGAKGFK
ncbi:MAG TPA: recombinase family protein [Oligoflexus sp.]|uniref:recombinase family protein n=1 Tax=Oligoflexus sp. TaxID=1971216 RepID=UPI002D6F8E74|nr:recombinase family protein [Oligoflexus sp.]HYX38652.1 recombinase family protein [Oligoflexus sp.]